MRNDLNRHDDDEKPRRGSESNAPLVDREVPLNPTTDLINRWLDGELPEPGSMRGDAVRHIDFWRRIGEETDRRRHAVTPAHVSAQIMLAIQESAAPAVAVVAPWYRRNVEMSAFTVIVGGAALVAAGMLVASMIR